MPEPAERTRMHAEAAEAPAAIARQAEANAALLAKLVAELRARPPRFVVTCARGSSDHAATYAKYLLETRLGLLTASASPSISSVYGVRQRLDGALLLAISQSGRSPDLLRYVQEARHAGARVVALVNDPGAPLAALADTVLALHAGPERSVAATKSYLATLAALAQLAAHWADDRPLLAALARLPEALTQAWALDWSALVDALAEVRNLYVVARGLGLGAAQEAALKLKETCGLHAEAFSAAEVRHGPMTLVGPGFPVLVLAQADDSLAGTLALAQEFRVRGAPVLLAAAGAGGAGALPVVANADPALAPLLAVMSFYRAVNRLALRRGRDPDAPPHLAKVTETW